MKWQIHDAQGTIRFATEQYPCDTREAAEQLIAAYDNDEECQRDYPQWFPMYVVGVSE